MMLNLKFSIICSKKLILFDKLMRLDLLKLFKFKQFYFVNKAKKMHYSELELVGLGYKISVKNKILRLNLGYSHVIFVVIPNLVFIIKKKTKLFFYSLKKKRLSDFVVQLLRFKKLNAYKIKGLKKKTAFIKLKPGKRAR